MIPLCTRSSRNLLLSLWSYFVNTHYTSRSEREKAVLIRPNGSVENNKVKGESPNWGTPLVFQTQLATEDIDDLQTEKDLTV